ncbi:MAG: hypothetical protein AB7S93_12165 [Xanthobacteraceae bacterium]
MSDVRARLQDNRLKYPLLNSERICWHIESAYTTMWTRWQDGKPPQAFAVEPGQES